MRATQARRRCGPGWEAGCVMPRTLPQACGPAPGPASGTGGLTGPAALSGLGAAGRGRLRRRQLAGAVSVGERRDLRVGELRLGRRRDLWRRLQAADLSFRL